MQSFALRIDVPYLVRSSLCQRLPFAPREFCRVCSRAFVLLPHGPRCFCCRAIGVIISIYCTTLFLFIVFLFRSYSTHKVKRKRASSSGGSYAVLSGTSDWEGGRAMRRQKAASNDKAGAESSSLPITSEGETSFAEIASSMSAEPPPSEDTSTTSSDSESDIVADSDIGLL